jgi:hypothetical protein
LKRGKGAEFLFQSNFAEKAQSPTPSSRESTTSDTF